MLGGKIILVRFFIILAEMYTGGGSSCREVCIPQSKI